MNYKVKKTEPHIHRGNAPQSVNSESIFLNSPAYDLTAADMVDIGNLSGTNTGDQDLSDLVEGPASAVDRQRVIFDGITGKLVKADGLSICEVTCSDFDIATTDFIDLFSTSATVAAGETIDIEADIWVCNRSAAGRVYYLKLDFGGSEALLDTRGQVSVADDATYGVIIPIKFRVYVSSTSLSYIFGRLVYGEDVTLGTTGLATSNSGASVTKFTGNLTGAKTIKLQIKSSSTTDTQTCVLLGWRIIENLDV